MPRTKQRTPELRDRLLDAALDMLEREGVAGFTTRRIAHQADTSPPAVYELFGDKAGLVREIFFEGFRRLRGELEHRDASEATGPDDPRAELVRTIVVLRLFIRDNPVLADVMFSRPFADFDPTPHEKAAGSAVRRFVVGRVRRCVETGVLAGDEIDIAHVLVALAQGLAAQERAGWLGRSRASIERRWDLAITMALDGLAP